MNSIVAFIGLELPSNLLRYLSISSSTHSKHRPVRSQTIFTYFSLPRSATRFPVLCEFFRFYLFSRFLFSFFSLFLFISSLSEAEECGQGIYQRKWTLLPRYTVFFFFFCLHSSQWGNKKFSISRTNWNLVYSKLTWKKKDNDSCFCRGFLKLFPLRAPFDTPSDVLKLYYFQCFQG